MLDLNPALVKQSPTVRAFTKVEFRRILFIQEDRLKSRGTLASLFWSPLDIGQGAKPRWQS